MGNISEDFIMEYIQKPSLEHIALVKISVTLWNQKDIWVLIECFSSIQHVSMRRKQWQDIEEIVVERAQELPLPETLKEKVLGCIKPIGLQILRWIDYHCKGDNLNIQLPVKLCWTEHGTVDRKKTAELIINSRGLCPITYKLAYMYFLESEIPKVWDKIPENYKCYFYNLAYSSYICDPDFYRMLKTFSDQNSSDSGVDHLLNSIENKLHLHSHTYLFELGAGGNKAAAENLLRVLKFKKVKECLVDMVKILLQRRYEHYLKDMGMFPSFQEYRFQRVCFYAGEYSDTLCFLLSHMDEEQRMQVFRSKPENVLECLLEWPWQSFFVKTASLMRDFLDFGNTFLMLKLIILKVEKGFKDYNYEILFGALWQQCSNQNKRMILEDHFTKLLSALIRIKDDSNAKLILKDATHIQKKNLIFSYEWELNFWIHLSHREEWDFIEHFVKACISSSDEMLQFKIHTEKNSLLRNKKHKRFVCLLDVLLSEYRQNESKVLC